MDTDTENPNIFVILFFLCRFFVLKSVCYENISVISHYDGYIPLLSVEEGGLVSGWPQEGLALHRRCKYFTCD